MKKLLLIILVGFGLTARGAAGLGHSAPKLELKIGGKDSTLTIKSGAVYYSAMAFTAPGKPTVATSLHKIYLANFELDPTTGPAWMNKPLTAPDQILVDLELTGEDGTKVDSPFKLGTYSAQATNANGLRFVKVSTFADGKQVDKTFEFLMGHGDKRAEGGVKITAVTADSVSGEVDLTEGDKSIKGTFTAKLPAPKK